MILLALLIGNDVSYVPRINHGIGIFVVQSSTGVVRCNAL